jgi:hypothetical protein
VHPPDEAVLLEPGRGPEAPVNLGVREDEVTRQ